MLKNILNWLKNMALPNKIKSKISHLFFNLPVTLLIIILSISMGCSGTKKLKGAKEDFQPTELNAFFNQLDLLEMKGKIKVSMVESGETYNANLTVREKDNKI